MAEILIRVLHIVERFRNMQELTTISKALFGVMLAFGIMNCLLGYRLMRFWMMLGGFLAGCAGSFLLCRSMGVTERERIMIAVLAAGTGLAVVAFLIYRLGVFLIGAGIGLSLSVYLLHPTTSFIFFVCMLIGAVLGMLAVRFSREIIIVGTSLLGGVFAGFALSRLGELPEYPYGLGMSAGFALLGILIQFATNRTGEIEEPEDEEELQKEEDYDECDEEAYEEAYREMYGDQPVSHILNRRKKRREEPADAGEPQEDEPEEEPEEIPAAHRRRNRAVQTEESFSSREESGLDIPIREWRDNEPEPTIIAPDRRRRAGNRRKKQWEEE